MSTLLGSTSPGTGSYEFTDHPNANVIGGVLTLPAGGPWNITRLGAFFGGYSAAATSKLVLYSTAGVKLAAAAATFEATGRTYPDDGDAHEQDLSAPYEIAGGTSIVVAFVCDGADGRLWRDKTSGTQYYAGETGSATSPANVAWSTQVPGPPAVWLYYEAANTAPNAPTLSAPANAAIVTTATPTLSYAATDPDADALTYDVQVSTDSSFATVTHWNLVKGSGGASGATVNKVYAGAALTRGATYYWRTRAYDGVAYGAWSSSRNFRYNQLPTTTLTAPADASSQTTATPTLQATLSDPDAGDTIAAYKLQVDNNSDFSSPTWDITDQTTGLSAGALSRAYGGSALSRGTTYYWRVAAKDSQGEYGAWSASRSFVYHSLPTTSARTPGVAALAYVTNLSDLAIWTTGGNWAKARFAFTYSQAEARAMVSYRLRIYQDSGKVTQLYDSGTVAQALANGAALTVDPSYTLILGTEYWWTILTTDDIEAGTESAATAFKVRWSQGLYEHDTGVAAPSDLTFTNGAVVGYASFAFRSATSSGGDGASGKTAWQTSMPAVVPEEWLQVLVRLSTATAGVGATVASMIVTYRGTAGTPDTWSVA